MLKTKQFMVGGDVNTKCRSRAPLVMFMLIFHEVLFGEGKGRLQGLNPTLAVVCGTT